MNGSVRISVVIPAYNAETTILDAISSVDAQGISDLEVIVIDDVSSDGTREVLAGEVAARDHLRIIERESNGGPAAARNDGVEVAQGEWLAFLDGDDAWLPGKLEAQLQLAHEHPELDLWCGGVEQVSRLRAALATARQAGVRCQVSGEEKQASAISVQPSGVDGEEISFREIVLEEFVNHNPVATSTVLVKREALAHVGGFDTQFVGPEDYDLWMRLALKHRLALIDAPLSQYRHVAGSLSMDDRKFLPQVLRVLEKGFGEEGALRGFTHLREVAISNQLWNASWMAFNRGARFAAIRYWMRSYAMNLRSERRETRKWGRLLLRYLFGRRV